MWWQRRPTRAGHTRPLGTPPARGTVRQLPRTVLIIGLPVAVAVAWALPPFGVSLATFLAFDLLAGQLRRAEHVRRDGRASL
ncbi:hypothetical protein I6A60_16640 [Frankia sp. AgB1.9]|uniref:hypothetical protein n=1 Tax=unclassified Frankia TaxID=2632575 RepID=UPI00193237AF|nr:MULTISPECIES: hypothetical protein [unclassified Frankia]MBL7487521.1 hypothetical protein [Frankia sp. AgW1.1]MBL7549492.1 hypothetical protein [Frankia sp. AgB1.9]MBL7620719.1 hypothetical protein [Frankia sp. AgB1.8]